MRLRKLIFVQNILLLFSIFFSSDINAQIADSSQKKNAIKLDLVPAYYDFFDYRKQIRVGLEYERTLNQKAFISSDIDIGLFDEYTFCKYYDFFNQNQGTYFIRQDATIKGFHLIPAYNYYLFRSKKKPNQGVFAGGLVEYRFYQKKLDIYNSQTFEKTSEKYKQTTLGAGVQVGVKYSFGKHFFLGFRTSFTMKILNHISEKDVNEIKALNAQWTDSKNRFWWVTNLKVGYAF
jgi:hypothetical protein